MDYRRASQFVRVVEAGSFSEAARALGLPKSSVSRGVAALERELGVRLLHRTTRALTLTDAGQRFFQDVQRAFSSLGEAEAAARDQGNVPSGTIRMTAPADAHAIGLGEALAEFAARYPKIHVDLSLSSRVVDMVAEGFDLALRGGKLRDSSLVAKKIDDSDARLFASPSYLGRRGRPTALADLAHHDVLVYRGRPGQSERAVLRMEGPQGPESTEVTGPVTADELLLLVRVATAGGGIGLFPTLLAVPSLERGELDLVLPEYRTTGSGTYLLVPTSVQVPARVTLLRDFLFERLSAEVARTLRACGSRKPHAGPTPKGRARAVAGR